MAWQRQTGGQGPCAPRHPQQDGGHCRARAVLSYKKAQDPRPYPELTGTASLSASQISDPSGSADN